MAYAAQSDLVPPGTRMSLKDLIGLTDDNKTGQVNAAVVNAILEEASGTVDSYCRNRYVTPLQSSDVVKARTLDIAVYLLFSRRREVKIGEVVRQRYVDAIAFLKDVSAGKAQLDQPTGDPPQQSTAGPVIASGRSVPKDRDLRFGDHNLKGYS